MRPVVAGVRVSLDWLGRLERTGRILGGILLVAALATNGYAVRVALSTQQHERDGRVVAATALCAVAGAVVDAGRTVLRGSAADVLPPRFERNLRRLGRLPLAQRRDAADATAAAYARAIQDRVRKVTHRDDLVRKDGSLDCERLRRVAVH